MSKLKLLQLQLALFFRDIEDRPDKFVAKMTEVSDDVFDNMPVILPVPINAPPEIPVVILNSSNGMYTCNISKSRIDFIVNLVNSNNTDISEQLENFVNKVRPYATIIFGYKKIIRFGFIGQYFLKTNTPVDSIQDKYLKVKLEDLEELSIRYNKRVKKDNLLINDIVELGKGNVVLNSNTQTGIILQRDINNVPTADTLPIEDVFAIIKSQLNKIDSNGIMEILV